MGFGNKRVYSPPKTKTEALDRIARAEGSIGRLLDSFIEAREAEDWAEMHRCSLHMASQINILKGTIETAAAMHGTQTTLIAQDQFGNAAEGYED